MANDDRSQGPKDRPKPGAPRSVPPPPKKGSVPPPPPGTRAPAPPPPPPRRGAAPAPKPGAKPVPVVAAGQAKKPRSIPPPLPPDAKPPEAHAPPAGSPAPPPVEHLRTDAGLGKHEPVDTPLYAQRMLRDFLAELGREKDLLRLGRLHYEVARLYESPLGDLDNAAEHYQKAYALCPDHVPTLRGARRVLSSKKNVQAALPLFDAEARYTSEPAAKALLFYEKGRLLEDHLAQKREARDLYAAALELDPTNPTYLKALERSDIASKSWDALEKTYERAANAVGTDTRHRAALLVERARLVEARKGDSRAATELYNEALKFDERAPGALEALKRLHYAHQRWRDLVLVLGKEAEQANDPSVRAMAYYRMGRILVDRLGHLDEGLGALERAAAEAPEDPMVVEELARLFELGKRWEALAVVLERASELCQSDSEKLGIYHRIGQIAEERLNGEGRAVTWFARALDLDPTYLPALQALAKIYTRQKRWQSLIEMHLGEADATQDNVRRAAAHARVAAIYEEQLGSAEQAAEQHARALGLAPGYAPSFKALSRIYQQAGKYRELIELFERAVAEAKDSETKITYLFKIGRVFEDALGAPQHALGAYKRVLEVSANHFGAIHAMQRAAERAGRYQDLVTALELEATKLTDKKLAVMLFHRAGEVLEDHLEDAEGALSRFKKVVELDKTFLPALASLGRLYYKAGRWEDLLDTYKRELDVTPKGPQSAALLYKMGELSEERIGRDDDAVAFFRRAIEADPFHTPSLHALERKLAERGQWAELVKLIELELSGLKDLERRARTAFHLGEVYENRMAQPEKALAAYDQSLVAIPDFRPAIDGRARLLTQARDFKRLVEELGREAEASGDPLMSVAALLRQGEVYRDELNDTRHAVESFEAVLARDPSHLGALLALEPLYAEAGTWTELARVYATEARVLGDVGARVAALKELARLEEVKGVGHTDEVRAAYIAILQLSPSDSGALAALERIALLTRDGQLLTHVDAKLGATLSTPTLASVHQTRLAETLEQLGDPSALDTYRAALARDPEGLAAAHGIVRLAEKSDDPSLLSEAAEAAFRALADKELGARLLVQAAASRLKRQDFDGAVRAVETALERHPDSVQAAEELKSLLYSRREVDRLFDALCQAAQWAATGERMAALWADVSELLADRKRDVPAGIAALHRVLEEMPTHVPTLMRLAALYSRDKQWAEAVDRLNQALGASPPPDVIVAAHLMLSRILKEQLGDEERALASINKVLSIEETNREALERLLEIQMRRGQAEESAATAAKLVLVSRDNAERARALCHLARLERHVKHLDAAAHAYEQAVSLIGLEGGAAAEFKDLLLEQKLTGEDPRWDYYVGALGGYAEQVKEQHVRSTLMLEVARVLGDEMQLSDRALHTLQRGLALDPDNQEMRSELAMRLKGAGHHQQAVVELRRVLDVDTSRADIWRALFESFQALGRPEEATQVMGPLVALGFANDLERAGLSARTSRTGLARPGSFDEVAFRGVDARGPNDHAAAVMQSIAESLGKVYPPELERYGLTSRDRITSRSGHPLKVLADRVATVFGQLEFDIYVHRAHAGSLEVELTDPPGILVPAQVLQLRDTEQVFLLARPIALMARGLHPIMRLSPPEIALLLVSAARVIEPTFGIGVSDEDFLTQQARRIQKAISRRARRELEETAPLYMGVAQIDYDQWAFDHRRTAARAAVILADDLPGSVALVRRTEGDLAGLRGVPLQQGLALVQDLVRYWVSDASFALRRRLGMM